MRNRHPAEPILRAYLDGELDWARAASCTLHLARCAPCAAALAELRALDQRTAALVARAGGAPWVAEARGRAARRRGRDLRLPVAGAVVGAAALLLLHLAPTASVAVAGPPRVKDVCCWDLDGGGRGDDGVFTRVRDGEVVECAIVYDDVDASHSLTPADVVRSAPPPAGCARPTAAAPPAPRPNSNS